MKMNRVVGALMGLGVMALAGCADDLYSPCNLDPQSQSPTQASCAKAAEDGDKVSCAIENSLQCDTGVCGVYEGSSAFCTRACNEDADCGDGGVCRDYSIIEPGKARYCVASELQ